VNDDLDILLTRYFDGSAGEGEVASLERHLTSDPAAAKALLSAARQELAFRDAHGLRLAAGAAPLSVQAAGELEAIADATPATARTETALNETNDNASRWRIRSWRPWAVAASLLLVAGLVWYVVHPGPANPLVVHPNTSGSGAAVATVEPAGPGVVIERDGIATPIDRNTALSANDRLRTGSAGATFSYQAETTRVTLGAASVLGISNDSSGKKLDLVAGTVDCEVEKQQPGQALVVATPQARVRVVGTQFRVITNGRLTRIEVGHGAVRVTRLADGATVYVSGGEFVDVGADATTRPAGGPGWPVARGQNMAEFWSTRIRPAGINE